LRLRLLFCGAVLIAGNDTTTLQLSPKSIFLALEEMLTNQPSMQQSTPDHS
jgi:hypothetical protein